jgi:hypothetical protein
MKAEEFDQAFDRGEDVSSALDLAAAQRPGLEQRRVNVDFPVWMIESLDREARRLGVTRQSVIKVWIAEHLERRDSAAALRGHSRPDRRQDVSPSAAIADPTHSRLARWMAIPCSSASSACPPSTPCREAVNCSIPRTNPSRASPRSARNAITSPRSRYFSISEKRICHLVKARSQMRS